MKIVNCIKPSVFCGKNLAILKRKQNKYFNFFLILKIKYLNVFKFFLVRNKI